MLAVPLEHIFSLCILLNNLQNIENHHASDKTANSGFERNLEGIKWVKSLRLSFLAVSSGMLVVEKRGNIYINIE
jgi:hypothetical protein